MQWGDEGKARVVDLLVQEAGVKVVARYNGGFNAGHTILPTGKAEPISLHGVPSGIAHPSVYNTVLAKAFVHPQRFLKERAEIAAYGLPLTPENYGVSGRCHVTLPNLLAEEAAREERLGKRVSTRMGIATTAAAKHRYDGVTVAEFVSPDFEDIWAETLKSRGESELVILQSRDALREPREALRPYVIDEVALVRDRWDEPWIFEGAQGTMLGATMGNYPAVTGSDPHETPYPTDVRIGVYKAFATRVGAAVRVGKLPPGVEERVCGKREDIDGEFGKTTGFKRDPLWFDVVAARHANAVAMPTHLVLTKLDRLRGVHPLRITTGYHLDGAVIDAVPQNRRDYERCGQAAPQSLELPGFDEDIRGARHSSDLPQNALRYVEAIEELLGMPFTLISVGPGRDEFFYRGPRAAKDAFSS